MHWLFGILLLISIDLHAQTRVSPTVADEALIAKIEASTGNDRAQFVSRLNSLFDLEHFGNWSNYASQDITIRDKIAGINDSDKRVLSDYIDTYYLVEHGKERQSMFVIIVMIGMFITEFWILIKLGKAK